MFRKLVSNVSFSPALVGQLSFYARRLRQEEAVRRLGLIFTVLALVVQSFAVFSAPEPANAASSNDMVYGGITSRSDLISHYDSDKKLRNIFDMAGITKAELQKTEIKYLNNLSRGTGNDAWRSYGYHPRFSAAQGEIKHDANGTTIYSRPHHLYGQGLNIKVLYGYSDKLKDYFAVQFSCGNLWTSGTPTPPPPPPPPPPAPAASCHSLTAIRHSPSSFRFQATANTKNGAIVSKYVFNIKDSSGKTIHNVTVNTSKDTALTNNLEFSPGKHTAEVAVHTSVGVKTSANCKTEFTVPTPGVSITKTVNNRDHLAVEYNKEFTYQIVVKNTGESTLQSLALSDDAESGISLLSANVGNVSDSTKWTHVLPSLGVGKSQSFTIKAKVTTYAKDNTSQLRNTVCVDTPSVPGSPDDCDDATIELPEKPIVVCELATDKLITIKPSDFDDSRHSRNKEDCIKIQVCDIGTDTIITIRKPAFDNSRHTTDLTECEDMQVCNLETGEIEIIARNNFDETKHSEDAADCVPSIAQSKSSINLTREGVDATTVLARSSDRIQYTITAHNTGAVDAKASFVEIIDDVVEYASVVDDGGGRYDKDDKTLTWPDVTLKPGESQSRMFTIQLADNIPAGARGISNQSSYDCVMVNTYGNSTQVEVDCPAVKGVETAVTELPTTGPRENAIFAGVLLAVVTYFYARTRQIKQEVRLIRRDLNTGTI